MRASVARRQSVGLGSPAALRSRSQERTMGSGRTLDFDNDQGSTTLSNGEVTSDGVQGTNTSSVHDSSNAEVRGHRRCMSDPFDTPELGGVTDGDLKNSTHNDKTTSDTEEELFDDDDDDDDIGSEIVFGLPTLPRYPVAQTQDKNCWSEPPVNIFRVRGNNYLSDKKKIVSGPFLLRARGCDLFLSENPLHCTIGGNIRGALGGYLRQEPTLVVRFNFPWGILVLYYEIPETLAQFMRPSPFPSMEKLTPPERTLAKWLMGDEKYRNERLKLIPYVAEGPFLVRTLVTGTPAIIGKRLPVSYRYTPRDPLSKKEDMFEVNLDIGGSSHTAKQIVSVCRRYMSSLTVDIGLVIEAQEKDELPEQMMGCTRVHGLDPVKAPSLDCCGTLSQRERTYT